jgi:NSS family neurotransmitter:Na+ symporter
MSELDEKTGRASFASHLGFILVAAGCSVGLGNVWRFPYVAGQSGGAIFCLFYFLFLILLGLPLMTIELAIGRASCQSVSTAFRVLTPGTRRWNIISLIAILGKYVLLSFYSVITGWLLFYAGRIFQGDIIGMSETEVSNQFGKLLSNPTDQFFCMLAVLFVSCLICYKGVRSGVEKITKPAMFGMLALMLFLVGYSFTLDGASKGIDFYLMPNLDNIAKVGWWRVINDAMNQVFFSLSIGIGCISIFGSYIGKKHSLLKDASLIAGLDTLVAFFAGLIIFPVCFSFGVQPDQGPTLIFQTLLNLFNRMANGQIFGGLFFVFLTIAALTTLITVIEGIIADNIDLFGMRRSSSAILTFFMLVLAGVPTILGFNVWADFHPLGGSSCILDFLDFILSNNLLPLGALFMVIFCISRKGWNWDGYVAEMMWGKNVDMTSRKIRFLKFYYKYCLTFLISIILIMGYISHF